MMSPPEIEQMLAEIVGIRLKLGARVLAAMVTEGAGPSCDTRLIRAALERLFHHRLAIQWNWDTAHPEWITKSYEETLRGVRERCGPESAGKMLLEAVRRGMPEVDAIRMANAVLPELA